MVEKGRKGLFMRTGRSKRGCEPPQGCFAVYVGAARERFVVRTECLGHPRFTALLDEAEEAYGYAAEGPLELPCSAEEFVGVLEEVEREKAAAAATCGVGRGRSGYRMLGPARPVVAGRS